MPDSIPQKKYLVTGGAGFIGSNFVDWLVRTYGSDVRVLVVDSLTYAGNEENLRHLVCPGSNVSLQQADICDAQEMKRVFESFQPDYVVNFAAETHVDRSIDGPTVFVRTNVLGTQNLLECARNQWRISDGTWKPGCKFLQISTDEVYGSLGEPLESPVPVEIPQDVYTITSGRKDTPMAYGTDFFTETTPLSPRSPYSASKASADMIVQAYHHTFGMPVNITRCSNNYGPRQFPEKFIPLIINNILENKPIPVYGKGINVRDWLYVDDHCHAVDMVLRNGVPGEVYNIGGFNEKQNIDIVREIIDLVAEFTGTPPRRNLISFVADRAGHDLRYAIDPSKTARALGWYPVTPFETGIRKTVAWYLDNRKWMENIVNGTYRAYYNKMYDNRR